MRESYIDCLKDFGNLATFWFDTFVNVGHQNAEMNAMLLDKTMFVVSFSRAIMCLHKPQHRDYQLYDTDWIPIYTKPGTVEAKFTGPAAL